MCEWGMPVPQGTCEDQMIALGSQFSPATVESGDHQIISLKGQVLLSAELSDWPLASFPQSSEKVWEACHTIHSTDEKVILPLIQTNQPSPMKKSTCVTLNHKADFLGWEDGSIGKVK